MKKILAIILTLCCVFALLTACNKAENESIPTTEDVEITEPALSETEPESTTNEQPTTEPTIVDPDNVHGMELNFDLFAATGEQYQRTDAIGSFPFFTNNEDFWKEMTFAVKTSVDEDNEVDNVYDFEATWNEIKDMKVADIGVLSIIKSNAFQTLLFEFLPSAQEMTVKDAILNCEWTGVALITKTEHMYTLFPEIKPTIAETFVQNYGQPTVMYAADESGVCNLGYYVDNYDLIFTIAPIPDIYPDSLPYEISVELTLMGEEPVG